MLVRAPTEFSTIVCDDGLYFDFVLLEERKNVVVEQVDSSHRQLGGIQSAPGVATMAIDSCLHIYASNAFERTYVKGVDTHQFTGVRGLNMPVSELGAEPFQKSSLLLC